MIKEGIMKVKPVIILFHILILLISNLAYSQEDFSRFVLRKKKENESFLEKAMQSMNAFTQVPFDKSYAIIIAIGEYDYLPPLEAPKFDAEKMKNFLLNTGEYDEIIVLQNSDANFENIRYFMQTYFPERMKKGRNKLLFYFTGHATQVRGYNDRTIGLLQLKEATNGLNENTINMSEIETWANLIPHATHMLFLLDCCFSGLAGTQVKGYDTSLNPLELANGNARYMMAAGRADEVSISSLKRWGGSLFTDAVLNGLSGDADANSDGIITINELFFYVQAAVRNEAKAVGRSQIPLLSNLGTAYDTGEYFFVYRPLTLPRPTYETTADEQNERAIDIEEGKKQKILFETQLPEQLSEDTEFLLNGEGVRVHGINKDEKSVEIEYLGMSRILPGVNIFSFFNSIPYNLTFWYENYKLRSFSEPYKNSHAILIAIDDYNRARDSQNRGKTGFDALESMVEHAEQLRQVLQNVGFPLKNIQTFYNEQATSEQINNALKAFWEGGEFSSADRLFLYFGGHGDANDNLGGYFITYDFDSKKPSSTSIIMEDLVLIHARNIIAHHMLIALDACHAGLTLSRNLDSHLIEEQLREFHNLSIIESDTSPKARNILLAGTGDENAIYQEGGIFTKALIDALKGEADMNRDGIIQFDELSFYIRDRVIVEAHIEGKKQGPSSDVLDRYGNGRIVFLMHNQHE